MCQPNKCGWESGYERGCKSGCESGCECASLWVGVGMAAVTIVGVKVCYVDEDAISVNICGECYYVIDRSF